MAVAGDLERFFDLNQELIEAGLMSEDILGGQTYEEIELPTEWETFAEFRITPEINELYTFSLDDGSGLYEARADRSLVHPIALIQLGTRPVLRQFPVRVPDGESSLHAKMDVEYLRPAEIGVLYREEGRLAEKYVRRRRRYLVTEGRFFDDQGSEVLRYRHTRMVGTEPAE